MKKIISILGFIMGLLIAGFLALMVYKGHDSRSMEMAPTLNIDEMKLGICGEKPNCVSSFQNKSDDHYIEALTVSPQRLHKIKEYFNACELKQTSQYYWNFTCKSSVFGFVDDIEVLYIEELKTLHYRSASRVGHSDMGANRKRIQALIEFIQKD